MREIKFRGFNRKNGVWLYGFYLQKRWSSESSAESNSSTAESRQNSAKANRGAHFVCPDEFADGKSWDDYEIDPKTRGEYTDMADRNHREIYEGDILYDHYFNNRFSVYFTRASFDVEGILEADYRHLSDVAINSEIIGNIHDNPELLKP